MNMQHKAMQNENHFSQPIPPLSWGEAGSEASNYLKDYDT